MNKYVFFILLGVLMFFNSCKTYKVIRYESKDFKVFEKKNYDFSQERMFDNNLVFAYFVKRSDYVDEWYVVGMKFYNKTGKAPSIKISDFTVKDQNGKIIFTADDIVLDESKLYKAEKMTDNGYYRYYFGFDRTIKVEDVKDQCYYVSCTLNGTEFKDTLIRVEKKYWGPFV